MDIQNLGFSGDGPGSDRQSRWTFQVYGPETMSRHGEVIAQDMQEILKSHGLDGKASG